MLSLAILFGILCISFFVIWLISRRKMGKEKETDEFYSIQKAWNDNYKKDDKSDAMKAVKEFYDDSSKIKKLIENGKLLKRASNLRSQIETEKNENSFWLLFYTIIGSGVATIVASNYEKNVSGNPYSGAASFGVIVAFLVILVFLFVRLVKGSHSLWTEFCRYELGIIEDKIESFRKNNLTT